MTLTVDVTEREGSKALNARAGEIPSWLPASQFMLPLTLLAVAVWCTSYL